MKKLFVVWMKEVDKELEEKFGMTSRDLPDSNYRDCWNGGVSAKMMANKVIKETMEDY